MKFITSALIFNFFLIIILSGCNAIKPKKVDQRENARWCRGKSEKKY